MKYALVLWFTLLAVAVAAEVRLNEAELSTATNAVRFRSWEGPGGKRNPEDLIIGVGERMAAEMVRKGSGGWKEGYFFRRILPVDKKMGADLFLLGPESEINHVVNLSRMLQGYLKAVYGFAKPRGESVAHFLLVYNAVKRNDREYLRRHFHSNVDAAIPEGQLGIDTDYTNWPGKTVIVIPTLLGQGLSATEVGRVATERVAEAPGGATNLRKEFLELRKEQATNGELRLAAEQEALKKKDAELERKAEEAVQRTRLAETPEERQRGKDEQLRVAEERRELDKKQREADRQVVVAAEEKAAIRKEESSLAAASAVSSNRQAGGSNAAGNEPEAFTLVKPKAKESGPGDGSPNPVNAGEILFLKTLGIAEGHLLQQLLLINTGNDSVRVAPVNGISGNHFHFIEGDPVVVVATEPGKQVLARIDRKELTIKARSTVNVFHSTKIWAHEDSLYAVGETNGQTHLCRFSTNLVLTAKSDTVVFPDTQLAFAEGKIYCTVIQGNQNSHVIIFGQSNLNRLLVLR